MMNEKPLGNVVELPLRVPEADAFEHEELARLYIAWRGFLLAGTMPKVTDFAPRRLGRLMAFAGIVEHAGGPAETPAPETPLRWRLAGSLLCRLSGREITGEEAFAGWQRFERATLKRLLAQTLGQQQPFLARLQVHLGNPMEVDGLELLALPLLDAARGTTVALLVFMPRFDTDVVVPACLETVRLTSLRTLHVDAREPAAAPDGHKADVLPLFGNHRRPA